MNARVRALAPLRHRDYRLLIGAVAAELFAAGMWTVVMVFQVIAIRDTPTALSMVAACLSAGLLAFALVGGIAADRLPKRAVLVAVQAVNLVTVSLVTALALSDAIALWHMAVASAVLGAGTAFFFPTYTALLPNVLPAEELLAANGMEGALRPTLQQGAGPAVAGMVVGAFIPATGAFIVAAFHACALVLLLCVRVPRERMEETESQEKTSVLADLKEGISFTITTPWLLWTLIAACVMTFVVMGPVEVLLPFITRELFDNGEQRFGTILAAFGVGGALGSLAVSSRPLPRRYLTIMLMCWGVGTLPLAVFAFTTSFTVMIIATFVIGFADAAGMVLWGTLLQRRVPLGMIGRVASLDFFVSLALMPVSIAVTGPLSTVVPRWVLFTVAGVAPLVLMLIALVAGRMFADEIANPLDTGNERVDIVVEPAQRAESVETAAGTASDEASAECAGRSANSATAASTTTPATPK
ncbi:MFS transporter [Rhodococcus sp. DMU2021]|uniref:MFS transporter n=1 Tax=Rhodococcus pyridinivorans TaxID=103816 RepID=A0A7M2XLD4_9NOCA|nr:MFS transporter [Rhodococcus sp. DMU2021]QOV98568.1 MFS transporter [Rhodococcus pyridinivorans]